MKDVIFEVCGQFVNAREISHTRTAISEPGTSLYLVMKNGDAIHVANGSGAFIAQAREKLKQVFASYADVVDIGKLVKE